MFELVLFDQGLEQAVTTMVRSGFYSTDDIIKFFHEIATDDPDAGLNPVTVDDEVLRIANAALAALAKQATAWPEKTDNDKLALAFQRLNEAGVRAVENFGCEASDCGELYSEIRGTPQWQGYCFYHAQDLIRAVLGDHLNIRYSAAKDQPTDDENRRIGKIVDNVLRAEGLETDWAEDPCGTISVKLDWQRRPKGVQAKKVDGSNANTRPWWKLW